MENPNNSGSGDSNIRNDLNGNNDDNVEDFAQAGNSSSSASLESHGGARPKIRRPADLNGLIRPALIGRPACEEDQKVPTILFNGEESQNGADFESDNDDTTNQVSMMIFNMNKYKANTRSLKFSICTKLITHHLHWP